MNNPLSALFVKTAAVVSVATLLAGSVFVESVDGQAAGAPPTGSKPIPRAADGKPDLSGVWITGALALLIGEEEARAIQRADAAAGRPAPPPREPPPHKPAAEAKRQEYLARRGIDDPMARCFLSGVPRITTRPLPFQIVQMPGQVIILLRSPSCFPHHPHRRPAAPGRSGTVVPGRFGRALGRRHAGRGRDRLQREDVARRRRHDSQRQAARHRSAYRADTYETIRYEVTMEDPEVFTKPWHQVRDVQAASERAASRNTRCIENNEDLAALRENPAEPIRI